MRVRVPQGLPSRKSLRTVQKCRFHKRRPFFGCASGLLLSPSNLASMGTPYTDVAQSADAPDLRSAFLWFQIPPSVPFHVACSSVGRAPGCGPGGQRSESAHAPPFGTLAQLVERQVEALCVPGSSPGGPTKVYRDTRFRCCRNRCKHKPVSLLLFSHFGKISLAISPNSWHIVCC